MPRKAVIIGAGPAGLTAAYELATRTDIQPIVLEQSDALGGISRTINYKGNRIDIGGHRFFSKSDRVMAWWANMLPMEAAGDSPFAIHYQGQSREVAAAGVGVDPDSTDRVMLVRNRKSRIYYLRKFFDYPLRLSGQTFGNLGPVRVARIGVSYALARLFPIRNEQNLEQFLINRFGTELYQTFFRSYTEKVWGVPCHEISAAWGAQRIKGLSITSALKNALAKPFRRKGDVSQKGVETSLVERFLYPKFGPGLMWETCADKVTQHGGEIRMNCDVHRILTDGTTVIGVEYTDRTTGEHHRVEGDYVFSTMPMVDLVRGLDAEVPANAREVSEGLAYRDFLTVGLLVKKMKLTDAAAGGRRISDNWVYIQEPDVRVGRLQVFNNWSPYMVADPDTTWLGLEYFCNESDDLWSMADDALADFGRQELAKIGLIDAADVLDSTVIRMPKAYPAYFGSYDRFDELRRWVDGFANLFLIGRNGMHRYNNQDHSMLTAIQAVDNILEGTTGKENLWGINAEEEYHEEKHSDTRSKTGQVTRPFAAREAAESHA